MIFKSLRVWSHWDTWCYFHADVYYLYYLIAETGPWEGFGVATSRDGVHWTDHGWAIRASGKMVRFLGTGSVWPAADFAQSGRFLCNYSEWRLDAQGKQTQNILFAWSTDLIRWKKFGDDLLFPVDTRFYEEHGRWDCICAIPREEGGYWGTWTATPKGSGNLDGGIGLGHSDDGLHWQALPGPAGIPEGYESGAFQWFGDHIHAMFGRVGVGMAAYRSKQVTGPYEEATHASPLLQWPHTYFSRFFAGPGGEILVNHHTMSGERDAHEHLITYGAPFKRAVIDAQGDLRLVWWPGNEALKGEEIPPDAAGDLQQGIIIEAALAFGPAGHAELQIEVDGVVSRVQIRADGKAHFTNPAAPEAAQREHRVDRRTTLSQMVQARILLRRGMLELYVDDLLMECWTMGCPQGRAVCLAPQNRAANPPPRLWKMTLARE